MDFSSPRQSEGTQDHINSNSNVFSRPHEHIRSTSPSFPSSPVISAVSRLGSLLLLLLVGISFSTLLEAGAQHNSAVRAGCGQGLLGEATQGVRVPN